MATGLRRPCSLDCIDARGADGRTALYPVAAVDRLHTKLLLAQRLVNVHLAHVGTHTLHVAVAIVKRYLGHVGLQVLVHSRGEGERLTVDIDDIEEAVGVDVVAVDIERLHLKLEIGICILTPDVFGIVGFASYALTNNLAKIKQAKERIDSITKLVEKGDEEVPFEFGTIEINNDDARIRLHFDCKPDEAMRDKLKKNGFRWSPSNSAWQRQLTNNAIRVTNELFNVEL